MPPASVASVIATVVSAILPEGAVRDEPTFIMLVVLLAGFIGVAIYLRTKRRKEEMRDSS